MKTPPPTHEAERERDRTIVTVFKVCSLRINILNCHQVFNKIILVVIIIFLQMTVQMTV